jgi:hypothetical protein
MRLSYSLSIHYARVRNARQNSKFSSSHIDDIGVK